MLLKFIKYLTNKKRGRGTTNVNVLPLVGRTNQNKELRTRHQLGADSYKYNHEVRDSHSLQIPDAPPLDLQGSHGKVMFADTPNR